MIPAGLIGGIGPGLLPGAQGTRLAILRRGCQEASSEGHGSEQPCCCCGLQWWETECCSWAVRNWIHVALWEVKWETQVLVKTNGHQWAPGFTVTVSHRGAVSPFSPPDWPLYHLDGPEKFSSRQEQKRKCIFGSSTLFLLKGFSVYYFLWLLPHVLPLNPNSSVAFITES